MFSLSMIENEHELRAPGSDEEWLAFHAIRRKVLFENRGKGEKYIENHPDDFKTGHHPLILLYNGVVIGVIRVEVGETVAWFRRVVSGKIYSDWAMGEFCFDSLKLLRKLKVVMRLDPMRLLRRLAFMSVVVTCVNSPGLRRLTVCQYGSH